MFDVHQLAEGTKLLLHFRGAFATSMLNSVGRVEGRTQVALQSRERLACNLQLTSGLVCEAQDCSDRNQKKPLPTACSSILTISLQPEDDLLNECP